MNDVKKAQSKCTWRIAKADETFRSERVAYGQKKTELARAMHACSQCGGTPESVVRVKELAGLLHLMYISICTDRIYIF